MKIHQSNILYNIFFTFIKSAFKIAYLLSIISQILRDSADVANISGLQPFYFIKYGKYFTKSGIHKSFVGGYL